MFKKHVGHFVMVSMKFFFDFDPCLFTHALLVLVLLPGLLRLSMVNMGANFQAGLNTVREDVLSFRQDLWEYKSKWEGSDLREALINNSRSFKENLSEIDIRNWRLK